MIELLVHGTPIAQQRPRFSPKSGTVFDPQSKAKRVLKMMFTSQMVDKGLKMLPDGILQVELYAHSPPPASWPQKRLKCVEGSHKVTTPDIDNIAKAYLDILNGIAYSDDKLIARLICEKRYSFNPRVQIIITQIGEK